MSKRYLKNNRKYCTKNRASSLEKIEKNMNAHEEIFKKSIEKYVNHSRMIDEFITSNVTKASPKFLRSIIIYLLDVRSARGLRILLFLLGINIEVLEIKGKGREETMITISKFKKEIAKKLFFLNF